MSINESSFALKGIKDIKYWFVPVGYNIYRVYKTTIDVRTSMKYAEIVTVGQIMNNYEYKDAFDVYKSYRPEYKIMQLYLPNLTDNHLRCYYDG